MVRPCRQTIRGARIQEGVVSSRCADIFFTTLVRLCQISMIMGPRPVEQRPPVTDFIIMVKGTANMFVTGPDVVKTVTHETVTFEELGGALTHASTSGVAHFAADGEEDAVFLVQKLLSYLPSNNMEDPPYVRSDDDPLRTDERLDSVIPEEPNKPYDMHDVISGIVDNGEFLEIMQNWAGNILIGYARLDGRTVGIVANQPSVLAGVLDINASVKAARFVRFCDCFNIPVVTFVDVPGFPAPQVQLGSSGMAPADLRHAEATVPVDRFIPARRAYA
jgi:acetyl-CoA carboxylase carboxyltransferase component